MLYHLTNITLLGGIIYKIIVIWIGTYFEKVIDVLSLKYFNDKVIKAHLRSLFIIFQIYQYFIKLFCFAFLFLFTSALQAPIN